MMFRNIGKPIPSLQTFTKYLRLTGLIYEIEENGTFYGIFNS